MPRDMLSLMQSQETAAERILVVDNDPVFLQVVAQLVHSAGYAYETARDGREAADMLAEGDFAVMLIDIIMPGMDGMKLLTHTRKHYPETDVVMMTGYHAEYGFSDVISKGAIDYLAKPFSFDELNAKLSRVMRERRLIHALREEIRDRELKEEILKQNHARQAAILNIYEMADASTEEITGELLKSIVVLSDSRYGLLGCIDQGRAVITVQAWCSNTAKKSKVYNKPFETDIGKGGVWPDLASVCKPIHINELANADSNVFLLPLHNVKVRRLLAVPAVENGGVVPFIALYNKGSEYDPGDVEHIQLFLDGFWNIVRRKRAEEAYRRTLNELERRVEERTAELAAANDRMISEIKERKLTEAALRKSEADLERRKASLEDANTALKVLLKKLEQDKMEFEERITANVKELIEPYLKRLKECNLKETYRVSLEILESNLNDIVSPFARSSYVVNWKLTPTEMKVANLVRFGKTTKEIAEVMNLSPETINVHRKKIRKKSGITNKKVNLRTVLTSLDT